MIVILNGSPRNGSCDEVTNKINCFLSQADHKQIKVIILRDETMNFCTGCLLCEDEGRCPQNDDGIEVLNSLSSASCIILVTPVYFDNVPAIVKNLIDRTNLITSNLKGKKLVLVTTGQADNVSWENCSSFIKNYCEIVGMNYLGSINVFARNKTDLSEEKMIEVVKGIEKYDSDIL